MLRAGVGFAGVMKLLGHKSPHMTLEYLEVTQQDLQREFHLARSHPRHFNRFRPPWFHQGRDLAIFNTCSEALRQAFAALASSRATYTAAEPARLERHCKMWVLMYGTYFEAFGEPGQRYVGVARTRCRFPGLTICRHYIGRLPG